MIEKANVAIIINNNELITKLRSGKEYRDAAITTIYNDYILYSAFTNLTKKYKIDKSEQKSFYGEAILQFVSFVVKNPSFQIETKWQNYVLVIARNILNKQAKKVFTFEDIENINLDIECEIPDLLFKKEIRSKLDSLLEILGKNCREVLTMWANSYSMTEIATQLNYQSEMMARKKKYQCLNQLIDIVKNNPEIKNYFNS